MFPGHLAAGLALKTAEPRTPTWSLILGVGLLDVVFGVLVLTGVEHVDRSGLTIPWSHSLAMALVWAVGYALYFRARGTAVVVVLLAAVLSHWLLDVAAHENDMSFWPGGSYRFGFSWLFGGNAGWFETIFVVAALTLYAASARKSIEHGRRWPVAIGIVGACYCLELIGG